MQSTLKTYLIVFLTAGIGFSLVMMIFDYVENIDFNLMKFLFDMVLYGALGTLVYFITIILPKKKTSPR